jgi:preprotein translocase subunit SecE
MIRYIKESFAELKKVAWPSKKTVITHSLLVVGVSVVSAVVIGALDFGLSEAFQYLINR